MERICFTAITESQESHHTFNISLFFGSLGVDRFMLGQTGLGIAKSLIGCGLGVWTLVNCFIIMGTTKEINFQMFIQNAS